MRCFTNEECISIYSKKYCTITPSALQFVNSLSVNLTNFVNLSHFSSFGERLSKTKYFTACNLMPTLKNKNYACGSLFFFNQNSLTFQHLLRIKIFIQHRNLCLSYLDILLMLTVKASVSTKNPSYIRRITTAVLQDYKK